MTKQSVAGFPNEASLGLLRYARNDGCQPRAGCDADRLQIVAEFDVAHHVGVERLMDGASHPRVLERGALLLRHRRFAATRSGMLARASRARIPNRCGMPGAAGRLAGEPGPPKIHEVDNPLKHAGLEIFLQQVQY